MIKTKTKLYNISSKNAENGSYKSLVKVNLPDLSYHNEYIQNVSFSVDTVRFQTHFILLIILIILLL